MKLFPNKSYAALVDEGGVFFIDFPLLLCYTKEEIIQKYYDDDKPKSVQKAAFGLVRIILLWLHKGYLMHAFKKLCLFFASVLVLTSSLTACDNFDLSKFFPTSSENSSSQKEENSSDETENSSQEKEEEKDDPPTEEELAQMSVVDEAYRLAKGESLSGTHTLTGTVTKIDTAYNANKGTMSVTIAIKGRETKPIACYQLIGEGVQNIAVGDTITVQGIIKNYKGTIEFDKNCALLNHVGAPPLYPDENDPYVSVSKTEFYLNYTPATDNADAYYRSQHGLMSGTLTVPDQAPVLSAYQPKTDGKYVRNSEMHLSQDGNAYTVVDAYGNETFEIYKHGAYIALEEVAAYVYAFGTYPANYSASKNTSPTDSVWGEYLRVNHTVFSGDTSRYPYEPKLPNITGCGGTLTYYEMDIGTTGTDCDPSYTARTYNDGYSITRGAARIVYGKNDLNGNGVYEIGEFHVFYTYNHYNDFQEYLNYQGGWGEKFGNVMGGGTLSSKTDYNPTAYVTVAYQPLNR